MRDIGPADLLLPVIPGSPREWEAPEELIERAHETVPDSLGTLYTEEAWQARQLIAARRWLLVRNEPANEPARSEATGRKETYFTYLGIDRPWNGLDDVGAWLIDELDSDNTDPSTEELVAAILGSWESLGRIEYIDDAKARELSMRIFMKSNGRVDLYAMAQPDAREQRKARELANRKAS